MMDLKQNKQKNCLIETTVNGSRYGWASADIMFLHQLQVGHFSQRLYNSYTFHPSFTVLQNHLEETILKKKKYSGYDQ